MMIFRRSIRWLWANLVILLMLQAMLLPVYGPWLDFRFAGLQPQHDHIYIGEVNLNHHTPDDSLKKPPKHSHHHDAETPAPLNAVVSLPDKNITWQGLLLLICTFSLLFLLPKESLTFSVLTLILKIQGILVPPLTPPPRL